MHSDGQTASISLTLHVEITKPCCLRSLQFRSTLAMLRRLVQVNTGTRAAYTTSFLFWWGQMSFFCIQPLRLTIKPADIDSVLILFTDHKRSLWKCQVEITEKWNPLFILISASSTHFYYAYISIYMEIFCLILS